MTSELNVFLKRGDQATPTASPNVPVAVAPAAASDVVEDAPEAALAEEAAEREFVLTIKANELVDSTRKFVTSARTLEDLVSKIGAETQVIHRSRPLW